MIRMNLWRKTIVKLRGNWKKLILNIILNRFSLLNAIFWVIISSYLEKVNRILIVFRIILALKIRKGVRDKYNILLKLLPVKKKLDYYINY